MARLMNSADKNDGQTKGSKSAGSDGSAEKVVMVTRLKAATKECPKRRPSFKTRGLGAATPSGGQRTHYRATKITISSSNVAALASKFNAVIVQDDVKGRAFVKKLQNPHRKPVKTTKGSVKAAIEIFENKNEKVAPKKFSDRPKIVLIRKNSSVARLATKSSAKMVANGTSRTAIKPDSCDTTTVQKKSNLSRKSSSNRPKSSENSVSTVLEPSKKNVCNTSEIRSSNQSCEEMIKNAKNKLRQTFILDGGSDSKNDRKIREVNKNCSNDLFDAGFERKTVTLSRLPKNSDKLNVGKENYFKYKTLTLPNKPDLKPKPDLTKISKDDSVDFVKTRDGSREQLSEKCIDNDIRKQIIEVEKCSENDKHPVSQNSFDKFRNRADRLSDLSLNIIEDKQKNFKPNNSFLWRQSSYKKEDTIREESEIIFTVTESNNENENIYSDNFSTRIYVDSCKESSIEVSEKTEVSCKEVRERIISNRSTLHSSARKLFPLTNGGSLSSEEKTEELNESHPRQNKSLPNSKDSDYEEVKRQVSNVSSTLISSENVRSRDNESSQENPKVNNNLLSNKSSLHSSNFAIKKNEVSKSSSESMVSNHVISNKKKFSSAFELNKTSGLSNSKDSGIDGSADSHRFSLPQTELTKLSNGKLGGGEPYNNLFEIAKQTVIHNSKDSGIDTSMESQRFSLPQTELDNCDENPNLSEIKKRVGIHNSEDSGIENPPNIGFIEKEGEEEEETAPNGDSCHYEEIVFRNESGNYKRWKDEDDPKRRDHFRNENDFKTNRTDYYDKISIDKLNILELSKVKDISYYDQIDRLNQDDHDHYTLISDYESNIYDDIVHVKSSGGDDASISNCYESIREGTLVKSPSQTSDSDSSWEHNNSLYALRAPSLHSSSSLSINSGGGRGSRAAKSETSDEWVDLEHSDEQQEILVLRERCRRRPSVNGWSVRMRRVRSRKSSHKYSGYGDENGAQNTYVNVETLDEDYSAEDYDDSFDSDSSFESDHKISLPEKLPETPQTSQNIYGLVKQAGKRMRKHWSLSSLGLNRIRKMSIGAVPHLPPKENQMNGTGNGTAVIGTGTGTGTGSGTGGTNLNRKRWSSFKSKFRNPSHSTSTFYLNDDSSSGGGHTDAPVSQSSNLTLTRTGAPPLPPPPNQPIGGEYSTATAEKTVPDVRRLSTARPSSPPPPPPPVRPARGEKSATKQAINRTDSANTVWYSELSLFDPSVKPFSVFPDGNQIYSNLYSDSRLYDSSNSNSVHDSMSDQGSSPGSDLHLRFADEPLYQFYTADIAELARHGFDDDFDGYEEIGSLRPTALELAQHRSLWCELPEVIDSEILGSMEPAKRKLQEAKFEVVTSEASYFKSLTVLDKHFVQNPLLNDEMVLSKNERRILFGNVAAVRRCSEKLLASLENSWQESIMLNGICDAVLHHANKHFSIYVKYCSSQVYLDRTLKHLKERNSRFNEALSQIESDPVCHSLSLHSFLMLPMQRITRLPLLIDAILSRLEPDDDEFLMCELTLATLNKIVEDCNEGARKFERYEEMLLLSRQLDFSRKDIKALPVVSSSRWLVRSGHMMHINVESRTTFSRKLSRHVKLHLFLFTDLLVITKKKSEENYSVIDYCARNLIQMTELKDPGVPSSKYLIMLTMLGNHEGKTVEMVLACDSETSRQRWLEALSNPQSSNPEETLYEQWDCPQVAATHNYTADQPDELSLQIGDIVNVRQKMADGWYHGERIRDGEKGWFPANHTTEVVSAHTRARNLKVRYRLLALSGNYLQSKQRKKA